MTIWTSAHLCIDKAILFVSSDLYICASAQRIAKFHGLRMQTANSSNAAISFLNHKSLDYFLLVVDESITCSEGRTLLEVLTKRWPNHRTVALCASIDTCMEFGLYRTLRKPVFELELSELIEEVRESFLSDSRSMEELADERLCMLSKTINKIVPSYTNAKRLFDFSQEYFSVCKRFHSQSGRLPSCSAVQDNDQFQKYLNRRVYSTVVRVCSRIGGMEVKKQCLLSEVLEQFELKGYKSVDRYINVDESAIIAMFALLQDYYSILGRKMSEMISTNSRSIKCGLGDRFTYNDLFSPLLSNVERGADLACLTLEVFLVAKASELKLEPHFDEAYSVSIIC